MESSQSPYQFVSRAPGARQRSAAGARQRGRPAQIKSPETLAAEAAVVAALRTAPLGIAQLFIKPLAPEVRSVMQCVAFWETVVVPDLHSGAIRIPGVLALWQSYACTVKPVPLAVVQEVLCAEAVSVLPACSVTDVVALCTSWSVTWKAVGEVTAKQRDAVVKFSGNLHQCIETAAFNSPGAVAEWQFVHQWCVETLTPFADNEACRGCIDAASTAVHDPIVVEAAAAADTFSFTFSGVGGGGVGVGLGGGGFDGSLPDMLDDVDLPTGFDAALKTVVGVRIPQGLGDDVGAFVAYGLACAQTVV